MTELEPEARPMGSRTGQKLGVHTEPSHGENSQDMSSCTNGATRGGFSPRWLPGHRVQALPLRPSLRMSIAHAQLALEERAGRFHGPRSPPRGTAVRHVRHCHSRVGNPDSARKEQLPTVNMPSRLGSLKGALPTRERALHIATWADPAVGPKDIGSAAEPQ